MTLVSGEGAKYVGETSDSGTRHGRGEYVWLNGDRYQENLPTFVNSTVNIVFFFFYHFNH